MIPYTFSPTCKNIKKPEWNSAVYQIIVVEALDLHVTWFLYEGTLESQYQDHSRGISPEDQLYF